MKTLNVTINGTAPMLMHSDRFANPLDPRTKAHKVLTAPGKKTDEQLREIARSEFVGSCYYREGVGLYIPGQNLDSCLIGAAKLQKLGVKFKQGVRVLEDEMPLRNVAKDPEALWKNPEHIDCRGVKVGTAKVMRYRPIFKAWQFDATVAFDEDVVNESQVRKALADAGALIGLGDYRPRFGRFTVEVQ